MSVSLQEIEPPRPIGSFMDACRLTAQQHGLQPDEQELERDWNALAEAVRIARLRGEMYLDIPFIIRSNRQLMWGANRIAGKTIVATSHPHMWLPDYDSIEGYTTEQLALGSALNGAVKMVIYSDNEDEPLLHFLGQPYDGKYNWGGEVTQLEEIDSWTNKMSSLYPNLSAQALSCRGILLIVQNRLNMPRETKIPLDGVYMRDGNLPRVNVDGEARVGSITRIDGQLVLGSCAGVSDSKVGVGLQMGLAEPQIIVT